VLVQGYLGLHLDCGDIGAPVCILQMKGNELCIFIFIYCLL